MARGRVEAVKHGGARGHCEKGRNGRRSKIQGARGPSMKSHLFNGRNFSNERSHLPRAFSSSIGFLADRAPPLPTTQTPLNPPRREGCFSSLLFSSFFLSFFLPFPDERKLTVETKSWWKEKDTDGPGPCPCFLIILKRSSNVSRLTFESARCSNGKGERELVHGYLSQGCRSYSFNALVSWMFCTRRVSMVSLALLGL